MSLNIAPTNLWREVKSGIENTRNHLKQYSRQIQEYHGKHYLGGNVGKAVDENQGEQRVENHAHDWLSHVLGRMVYENPQVDVGTRRPDAAEQDAMLLHHGMNRWVPEHDFVSEFELCARDMQFNWGVALITSEPVPDARPEEFVGGVDGNAKARPKGVPWSPSFYRISQRRYFWDPMAVSASEARFEGHIWTRPAASLLEEAERYPDRGWNVELIEKLSTDAREHAKDLGRETSETLEVPDRDEIVGVTIWVKDRQIEGKKREDGFHGTLYTIALDPVSARGPSDDGEQKSYWANIRNELEADGGKYKDQYLREPYAFFGPRTGPYEVGVVYTVPDDPAGLGPITVSQELNDELNLVSTANTASAKRWKRGAIIGGKDKKVAGQIKDAPHDSVHFSASFQKGDLAEYQVGGLDPQGLEQELRMREKLERSLGLSDAQKGLVTGKATASENIIAQQASSVRMDFIEKKVYRFAQRILRKVAWYMWHDNKVAITLGPDAAADLGYEPRPAVDSNGVPAVNGRGEPVLVMPTIQYQGGADGSETRFEDLEITIKPYSMQRTDEGAEQANTMQWIGFLLQALPMVRAFPEVEWADVFEAVANAFNQPDGAKWVNVAMSQEIGAMMMGLQMDQAALAEAGQSSQEQAPQFAGYAGVQGGLSLPFAASAPSDPSGGMGGLQGGPGAPRGAMQMVGGAA